MNSNPRFPQKSRLSMNSPLKDQRPKTGTFLRRPGTSTGVPLRSTLSSYNASSHYSSHENNFSERPTTGISTGFYSRLNTKHDDIRSDGKLKSGLDTPIGGYKSNIYIM